MRKFLPQLLFALLLTAPALATTVDDLQARVEHKLNLAAAKGQLTSREAGRLRSRLDAIVKRKQSMDKSKVALSQSQTMATTAELNSIEQRLDRAQKDSATANRWLPWF